MGLREDSKQLRRHQILLAARDLMRKTGDSGFSMRILASRAGVSIATPYNLFGSKQEILHAVLDADLASYQSRLNQLQVNPLERVFQSITLATAFYSEQPGFYRAILVALNKDGEGELRTLFSGPRQVMMNKLVRNAQTSGYLRKHIRADYIARTISYVFFAGIVEWVSGLITLAELEVRAQFGAGLALAGAATQAHRQEIESRVDNLQDQLTRIAALPKQRIRLRATDDSSTQQATHIQV